MRVLMSVVNNEISGAIQGNGAIFSVRDTSDKRNASKRALFECTNNIVRLKSSDYSVNRTSDMWNDVRVNLRFLLGVL